MKLIAGCCALLLFGHGCGKPKRLPKGAEFTASELAAAPVPPAEEPAPTSAQGESGAPRPTATPGSERAVAELIAAVERGDSADVESILRGGTPVDSANGRGGTALHAAAMKKNHDMVTLLLGHGADIDKKDSIGQTALFWAANRWDWELVQLLLDKGAKPTVGLSPLPEAVRNGKTNLVKTFIEKGCGVNGRFAGMSLLQLARHFNHTEIVEVLTAAGAKE